MNEWTPTTEDVRGAYSDVNCDNLDDPAHAHGCPKDVEFDRWLAAHDAATLDGAARVVRAHLVAQRVGSNAWADVHNIATDIEARAAVLRDTEGKAE